MEVILLEKVANLGDMGDLVKVKPGYGRNHLVPKGKATPATAENIALFEARRAELERQQADELAAARARADKLSQLELTIPARAGSEGKLFGSLGTADIAEACTAAGCELERSEVRLPDGPIRSTGEHQIDIQLHADVALSLSVTVVAENAASA